MEGKKGREWGFIEEIMEKGSPTTYTGPSNSTYIGLKGVECGSECGTLIRTAARLVIKAQEIKLILSNFKNTQ